MAGMVSKLSVSQVRLDEDMLEEKRDPSETRPNIQITGLKDTDNGGDQRGALMTHEIH